MTDPTPPRDLREVFDASERGGGSLQARLEGAQGVLDAIRDAIYIQDDQGRFLEVNAGAAEMYGYPREFFIGKTPEVLSAQGRNDSEAVAQAFGRALHGVPQRFEYWGLRRNGEVFPKDVRVYPGTFLGQAVVIAIAQDISERKQAERTQEATYRVAEAALESRDTLELFQRLHAIVRGLMPAENLYFALWDQAADTVSFPYWVDAEDPLPQPRKLRRGLTEYVLRSGKPLLVDTATLAELEASGEVEPIGTLSLDWMGIPLRGESGVFGALVIQSYGGGHRYTPADRDLLAFVSAQAAMAIERTRAQAEQRLLTAAMDSAADPIFGINAAGRFVFVNRAACAILGYSHEEFQRLRLWDIAPGVSPEIWPTRWEEVRVPGSMRMETRHRRKDGSMVPVEITSHFLSLEGRDIVFTHARDISSRKAAEEALRASEDKFSKAFHASPDAINLTRLSDGAYLDVNEGFERMTGWSRAEALGRTSVELGLWVDPADRERVVHLIQSQGEYADLEIPFRLKDGRPLTGLMSGRALEMGGVPCLLSVTRDITAWRANEAALRSAEQRLRTVLANSQAVIFQLDPEARFMLSEGLGLAALGLAPGQAVGLSALEMYQHDPDITSQIHLAMEGEPSRRMAKAAGRTFDHNLTPVLDAQGRLESIIGIATDMTERQQIEEALRAERGLFVGGPVMVIRWQAEPPWPVDYISPNVQALLGYSPEELMSGQVLFNDLVHPEDRGRIHREADRLRQEGVPHFEQQYRLLNAAGEYRWFHDFTTFSSPGSDAPYHLGYMLDITERLQAEEALRQTQKLESLGLLAGGIAHDFNNLLTVVLGNLNLAQMKLPASAPARAYLDNMEATVLRATDLTKQMLAYSGRGHFLVKAQDLNEVVREVTHLLEVSISKKIRLRLELEPDLPCIQADAAQVQQVVMNLVTNASDAIGDREGVIHLSTSLADLDGPALKAGYRGDNLVPGPQVLLEVADTGCGMAAEVLARIFDPFYTTKATGRGLGLSAMLGILRGHSAGLRIHSEVGRGSSFQVCFPASQELAATAFRQEMAEPPSLRGLVLLVDDEFLILQTMTAALEALGLEVVTAKDGQEALERFQMTPRPDLVLMDLTMPRLDGRAAFQAMHELDPSVPVVLSSGYTEQDSLRTLSGQGPAGFMQKPYQIKELHRLLRRVLGG